jgi:hypothetical protein
MRAATVFALLVMSAGSAVASRQLLDPRDGVVLPERAAKDLLHQCSRNAPQHVTGTWLPTSEQIREVEARLPGALGAIALRRGSQYRQPKSFQRQYAGFLIDGGKIIYVNAFPDGAGDPNPNAPPGFDHFDWRQQAVIVCDGGPAFFGVEYDPAKKTLSHFEFNGSP